VGYMCVHNCLKKLYCHNFVVFIRFVISSQRQYSINDQDDRNEKIRAFVSSVVCSLISLAIEFTVSVEAAATFCRRLVEI
jgi:hypothetical protein